MVAMMKGVRIFDMTKGDGSEQIGCFWLDPKGRVRAAPDSSAMRAIAERTLVDSRRRRALTANDGLPWLENLHVNYRGWTSAGPVEELPPEETTIRPPDPHADFIAQTLREASAKMSFADSIALGSFTKEHTDTGHTRWRNNADPADLRYQEAEPGLREAAAQEPAAVNKPVKPEQAAPQDNQPKPKGEVPPAKPKQPVQGPNPLAGSTTNTGGAAGPAPDMAAQRTHAATIKAIQGNPQHPVNKYAAQMQTGTFGGGPKIKTIPQLPSAAEHTAMAEAHSAIGAYHRSSGNEPLGQAHWMAAKYHRNMAAERHSIDVPESLSKGKMPFPVVKPRYWTNEAGNEISEDGTWYDAPVSKLIAQQERIDPNKVREYAKTNQQPPQPGEPDVTIIRGLDGKEYIEEGHHRSAAAALRGDKTVRARLFIEIGNGRVRAATKEEALRQDAELSITDDEEFVVVHDKPSDNIALSMLDVGKQPAKPIRTIGGRKRKKK